MKPTKTEKIIRKIVDDELYECSKLKIKIVLCTIILIIFIWFVYNNWWRIACIKEVCP